MFGSSGIRLTVVGFVVMVLATGASMPMVWARDGDRGLTHADFPAIGTVKPAVLDLALGAADCAVRNGVVESPATLTVIDYSLPSTARRLWVYDIGARSLVYQELVAHGSGSGDDLATSFSNVPESHQSSLGLYVTDAPYVGRNGYSLRMDGLDPGFNDRARERAIVIHGAPYVSDVFAKAQGRLGRSWGCPAVRSVIARNLIDRVSHGGLVFVYYPDPGFLAQSRYVQCALNPSRLSTADAAALP